MPRPDFIVMQIFPKNLFEVVKCTRKCNTPVVQLAQKNFTQKSFALSVLWSISIEKIAKVRPKILVIILSFALTVL